MVHAVRQSAQQRAPRLFVDAAASMSARDNIGKGSTAKVYNGVDEKEEEEEVDSPVRRELLYETSTSTAAAEKKSTTAPRRNKQASDGDNHGDDRCIDSSVLPSTKPDQHFKRFHLELLEHLSKKEIVCRDPQKQDNSNSNDNDDSVRRDDTILSMARKFLDDRPELVAARNEARRMADVHKEAENVCPPPPLSDSQEEFDEPTILSNNKKRKLLLTQAATTPRHLAVDDRYNRAVESMQQHTCRASTGPALMLSSSFRMVEHVLRRQAESTAQEFSTVHTSSVAPLLAQVQHRIELLQNALKNQQDAEEQQAQRLIDQLLSTQSNRRSGTAFGSAVDSRMADDSNTMMTTALQLRLWNLLCHDLEALAAE